jgi:hypothetical protein
MTVLAVILNADASHCSMPAAADLHMLSAIEFNHLDSCLQQENGGFIAMHRLHSCQGQAWHMSMQCTVQTPACDFMLLQQQATDCPCAAATCQQHKVTHTSRKLSDTAAPVIYFRDPVCTPTDAAAAVA